MIDDSDPRSSRPTREFKNEGLLMAYPGKIRVDAQKLIDIAESKGASVRQNKSYRIVTKPRAPHPEVVLARGKTTTWIELRGTPQDPYYSSTPGIVPHKHESSSIRYRVDTDTGAEQDVVARFAALIDDLLK